MKPLLTLAAVSVAMALAAAPAMAQTAPPAPASALAENDRLAVEAVKLLFEAVGFQRRILGQSSEGVQQACAGAEAPDCPDLYRAAAAEELDAQLPEIEREVGRRLAEGLTERDLRAGLAFLRLPEVAAALASAGDDKSKASPAFLAAVERLEAQPGGRAFLGRYRDVFNYEGGRAIGRKIGVGARKRFEAKLSAGGARDTPR